MLKISEILTKKRNYDFRKSIILISDLMPVFSVLNLTPVLGAWTKVSKNQLNLFLLTFNATPEISLLVINL